MSRGPSGRPPKPGKASTLFVRCYREFPSAPDQAALAAHGEAAPGSSGGAGPGAEEAGKFVILSRGSEIHLVLSPVAFTPYHADIVRQYLQIEGRGRVEGASSTGCRILSPEWDVRGGGHYAIEHWLHHIRLHGKSSAFGKYDFSLLDPFRDEIPERLSLGGYTFESQ